MLLNIHKFWNLASRADRYFRHHRPDAVVLIDYPGFNWWIARRAKAHGIPVFYYGAPQLWAWAGWRIKKMRRFVDHVLCKLPFEEAWYRERGCNATFVGHPYFDQLRAEQLDAAFIERLRAASGPLVAILPGSRTQEVKSNFGYFLKAARIVHDRVPNARFAVASFKPSQAEMVAQRGCRQRPADRGPRRPHAGDHRRGRLCDGGFRLVSLELLYHTKPTVILYYISRLAFFVQTFFRKVRYITLVNLLTATDLFPKRVATYDPTDPVDAARADARVSHLRGQIGAGGRPRRSNGSPTRPSARARVAQLAELKERVGHGGASRRAADYMLDVLDARQPAGAADALSVRRAGRRKRSAARRKSADCRFRIADCGLRIE